MASQKPVLPGKKDLSRSSYFLDDIDSKEDAYNKTMFQDRDTGKYYIAVSDGDFIEVPTDEAGVPMYDPLPPVMPKGKKQDK